MDAEIKVLTAIALYVLSLVGMAADFTTSPAIDTHPEPAPPHHTPSGFRNPNPEFKEAGFKDMLPFLWGRVVASVVPKRSQPFEVVPNDGAFLRENADQNTITWVGHSTLLVQMNGVTFLTDPIWSERASPVDFAGPQRYTRPGLDFDDLPPIDFVLISHDHYDHLDKETVKRLAKRGTRFVVPLRLKAWFAGLDIKNVIEMDWWDSTEVEGATVHCTPAQHFSGRGMGARNQTLWASYVVEVGELKLYFGGDSGYFSGYTEIGQRLGPIDVGCLPIGAYLPPQIMRPVHLDPAEAVQAFVDLGAGSLVPIHFGTFDLSEEPRHDPPRRLMKAVDAQGISPARVWLLKHGETRVW